MARVICPFCLKPHDFTSSLHCESVADEIDEAVVPASYVRNYHRIPPLWLVTCGFPQHGKTTYLAALTMVLEEHVPKVWEAFYSDSLDQYTMDAIRQMRRDAEESNPAKTTDKQIPRPLLLNVCDMPDSGSRCLVMYDVAGEVYDSLSEVQQYVTAIKQVSTTWFLVSLTDLEKDKKGRALPDLFGVYLAGMEKLRVDLRGRSLIVVYTKGDTMEGKEFEDYLTTDPLQAEAVDLSLTDYLAHMQEMSDRLEDYTRKRVPRGAAFINRVKAQGMRLVFCLTSALGTTPDQQTKRLSVQARPLRVFDPLLWAIRLESTARSRTIGLVVDASGGSQTLYDHHLVTTLWERLVDYGEVTTYSMGRSMPVWLPGQEPAAARPAIARHRLLGSILEQAPSDMRFLVVSTGPILDLQDFYHSPWRERVLLVVTDQEQQQEWPQTVVYRPGDDPAVVIEALLALYEGEKL